MYVTVLKDTWGYGCIEGRRNLLFLDKTAPPRSRVLGCFLCQNGEYFELYKPDLIDLARFRFEDRDGILQTIKKLHKQSLGARFGKAFKIR